jgi:predicted nucleotidyltransferase
MTVDELGRNKRAAILAIAAKHGVRRVRVFGAFARGDARVDSDLDLPTDAGPRAPPSITPSATSNRYAASSNLTTIRLPSAPSAA